MAQSFRWGRIIIPLLISVLIVSCKKDDDAPALSHEKQLLTFKIDGTDATIDAAAHTVSITTKAGYDLTKAVPVITVSGKASVSPASGVTVDLSKPVTYTVTAEDKTTQTYTVTAKNAIGTENRILTFTAHPIRGGGQLTGEIDDVNHIVTVKCDFSYYDLQNIEATVTVSPGATVSPRLFDTIDLRITQYYRVRAENGAIQEYTIKAVNTDNKIVRSSISLHDIFDGLFRSAIPGQQQQKDQYYEEDIAGFEDFNFLVFYAAEGEDVSALTLPRIDLPQGATISPAPDVPQDFNKDVKYTVTSQTGASRVYTFRVVKRRILLPNEHAKYIGGSTMTGNSAFIYYYSGGPIQAAIFVNDETKEEVASTFYDYSHHDWGYYYHGFIFADGALKKGNYTLKVKLYDGSYFVTRSRYVVQ
jgi:hypothetical protein